MFTHAAVTDFFTKFLKTFARFHFWAQQSTATCCYNFSIQDIPVTGGDRGWITLNRLEIKRFGNFSVSKAILVCHKQFLLCDMWQRSCGKKFYRCPHLSTGAKKLLWSVSQLTITALLALFSKKGRMNPPNHVTRP